MIQKLSELKSAESFEKMSAEQFIEFKKQFLDKAELTPEDIHEIFILSGGERPDIGYLDCSKMHVHNYTCRHYHSPFKGVIDRLIQEIIRLKTVKKQRGIIKSKNF